MTETICSVALYCEHNRPGHVTETWFHQIVALLTSQGLRIREYGVGETLVRAEGMYPYTDVSGPLGPIQTGGLPYLELYCHPTRERELFGRWNGAAILSFNRGDVYVGVPATAEIRLKDLLRQVYTFSKPLGTWPYGIAYIRSALKDPSCYAAGFIGGVEPRLDETPESLDRISRWACELRAGRRHLQGYFRDVYPANLLSEKHLQANIGGTILGESTLGHLEQLDADAWLWTVPEDDIWWIRALMEANGLILTDRDVSDDEDE